MLTNRPRHDIRDAVPPCEMHYRGEAGTGRRTRPSRPSPRPSRPTPSKPPLNNLPGTALSSVKCTSRRTRGCPGDRPGLREECVLYVAEVPAGLLRRGRGRTRGRRCTRGRRHIRPVRPVRLVAGWGVPGTGWSGESKRWPARIFHPPPRTPPATKWRNDAILRMRWSRRAPERYAPATFFRRADASSRDGGPPGGAGTPRE